MKVNPFQRSIQAARPPVGFGLLLLLLTCSGMSAASQETVVVTDEVSCPECEIKVTLEVSLGGRVAQQGLVCGSTGTVATDSAGRFYVVPTCEPGTVDVYGPDGSLIETFGALGQGPGEFGHITGLVVADDDSIHVFDSDHRHSILNNRREHVRTIRMRTQPWQVLLARDGTSIHQAMLMSPEHIGLPLHVVDADGVTTLSFGAADRTYRADRNWRVNRAIAWADEQSVWSVPFAPYAIELWDTSGRRERLIRRDAKWFPERDEEVGPTVRSIRQDDAGRLWVAIVVPSEEWDGEMRGGALGLQRMLDTVIEVIDPNSGDLISSITVDQVFSWWATDRLYSYREEGDGNQYIDIWTVQLLPPKRRGANQ